VLNNVFQTLGDMETGESTAAVRCGILISDTSLYQRNYPDGILENAARNEVTTVMRDRQSELDRFTDVLFRGKGDMADRLRFEISNILPAFYGLTLPLLKYGMPVRPVLLDNLRRFNGYLDDYQVLVMSYEYCKPEYPDENAVLAAWVRDGGTLIYVGDGGDPFHQAEGFWSGKYPTAAHHLLSLLDIEYPASGESVVVPVGRGYVGVWNTAPSAFCHSHETAEAWRGFFRQVIGDSGYEWKASNRITQAFGERVAMNAPIQGTAADIIKIAMVKVSDRLKRENLDAELILQVHDELIVESSPADAERARVVLQEEMENACKLSVPLVVDINTGKSWYDTK
jgi:hypothetical protein